MVQWDSRAFLESSFVRLEVGSVIANQRFKELRSTLNKSHTKHRSQRQWRPCDSQLCALEDALAV